MDSAAEPQPRPIADHSAANRWPTVALLLCLGVALAVFIGRIAALVEAYYAPFVVFSLGVGCVLGGCCVVLMRLTGVRSLLVGALSLVVIVLIAATATLYFTYRDEVTQYDLQVERDPRLALAGQIMPGHEPPPASFSERISGASWGERGKWLLDLALTLAAAETTLLLVGKPALVRFESSNNLGELRS